MKISSWNVNGIRSVLGKGLKEWLWTEAPDVLCLQEIKARPEQLNDEQRDFSGYGVIWNPAQRPGYSGVATFCKETPPVADTGFGEYVFDVEGRVIRTRHADFWLYNVYFPSGQRGGERYEYKLNFYDSLLKAFAPLMASGENIIITGDFNIAHTPLDLHDPIGNKKTSGFLPEERAWVDRYLSYGLVDIYRHFYPARAQYTWWTYRMTARQRNLGWRIDYFLVSESLVPRIKDVKIHDDIPGSDHCPISLVIDE